VNRSRIAFHRMQAAQRKAYLQSCVQGNKTGREGCLQQLPWGLGREDGEEVTYICPSGLRIALAIRKNTLFKMANSVYPGRFVTVTLYQYNNYLLCYLFDGKTVASLFTFLAQPNSIMQFSC
jgi:hypothetical protein